MLGTEVFNRRICILVARFFEEELAAIYKSQGWVLPPWQKKGYEWSNGHFQIRVVSFYSDKAIQEMEYWMQNVPSYTEKGKIDYCHKFCIRFPRAYPNNLQDIQIENATFLYHPRIAKNSKDSKPCLMIRGDVDVILRHLIYFVLLKPDIVLPQGSDNGLNHEATSWYREQGIENVYRQLLNLWRYKQVKTSVIVPMVKIIKSRKS